MQSRPDASVVFGLSVWQLSLAGVVALAATILSVILGFGPAVFFLAGPYTFVGASLGLLVVARFRQERAQKAYLDVVAALEGMEGATAAAVAAMQDVPSEEVDLLLLSAVHSAKQGDGRRSLSQIERAGRHLASVGSISGDVALCFPGLEPVWFGPRAAVAVNYQLILGNALAHVGRYDDAARVLGGRLVEPHFAQTLATLADVYERGGATPQAIGLLRQQLPRVSAPSQYAQLQSKLATLLESVGELDEAAKALRMVVSQGEQSDARERLERIESDLHTSRQAGIAAQDDAEVRRTLEAFRAARGPKSRARVLESGLARLIQPAMRERLLLEASRQEVEAVLEKVHALKTKKAKIRNLCEALDQIRDDDVPDELQRAEIELLEAELARIERDG